jgi:L-fuconolactonase
MYIDSHQHFWKISRGDYSWMSPDNKVLYRDFSSSDLFSIIKDKNISQTIIIQAADTVAETEFILNIANKNSFISGVVGWVDFNKSDVIFEIDKLSQNKYLKGFRPMIHDIANENWMLNDSLDFGFKYLIKKNLTFDALVRPKHLKNLYIFAKKYNNLLIVINHIAKPNILNQEIDEWKKDMKKLSELENVFCKYSGVLTEVDKNYSLEQIKPYVDFIFEIFKTNKIMWGSDWPVLTMVEKYENWFEIAQNLISHLSDDEKMNIFSNTAANFYKL